MLQRRPEYGDYVASLFHEKSSNGEGKKVISITFQVTTDCSLRCTYCYQINKGHEMMSWDTAKAAIDYILAAAKDPDSLLSYDKNLGVIIDFIGGEPLLNIDLIKQIIDYFETRLIVEDSPWKLFHKYSISSNGVAYFDPRVQALLAEYGSLISISITVDGHKDLHDKCRLFPNGEGSYDIALKASLTHKERFGEDNTKITLSPENVSETSKAVCNMLSLGYKYVFANCAYEEGWKLEHATTLYYEMKKISDYILDNDLEDDCCVSLFNKEWFRPMCDTETQNWCGGNGSMIAVDYRGLFYPCLRYMDSSLGCDCKPIVIGNVKDGIYTTQEQKRLYKMMSSVTRQSQSTEECLNCPVANGCSWCSAYNYQKFGTINKRATFICVMHKAMSLGNWYYWKKEAQKKGIECDYKLYLPVEEAKLIIGEEEWSYLASV